MTKATYDAVASVWTDHHNDKGFWALEMTRFQELLPSGSVLEIGSGSGRDASELAALGYRYVGTDVSPGFLSLARAALPTFEFYEQSVYDLNFQGELFDGFWSAATLLHIPKLRIDEALQRIKTVVRPGGFGFISLKNGEGEALRSDSLGSTELKRFFAYWGKDEFIQVLKRNGCELADYMLHEDSKRGNLWHCFFVQIA